VTEILVEVQAVPSGNLGPRAAMLEQFEKRATEIADSVAEVAEKFRTRLEQHIQLQPAEKAGDQLPGSQWRLDNVELTFQLALQAQGGIVIKASGGATFGVKLTWTADAREG
jgi:Trypsin-co-occurring domain 1